MKTWEYISVTDSGSLNTLGKKGWEAYAVTVLPRGETWLTEHHVYHLKREIEQEP